MRLRRARHLAGRLNGRVHVQQASALLVRRSPDVGGRAGEDLLHLRRRRGGTAVGVTVGLDHVGGGAGDEGARLAGICVAPTCFSWATSGACIDAAVASRACRWARFAGRLASWSRNTTTTRSRLPDERALTWLRLSLEKLGLGMLARVVEATLAWAAPVIAVTASAAAPSNETAFRRDRDISASSIPALCWGLWMYPGRPFRVVAPVSPRIKGGDKVWPILASLPLVRSAGLCRFSSRHHGGGPSP